MEAFNTFIEFITKNWWEIILVLTLLKYRRKTGITLCTLELVWNVLAINDRLHAVFVIAFGFIALLEKDDTGNRVINMILPPVSQDDIKAIIESRENKSQE